MTPVEPDFRCAAAALARDEPVAGTASTVRAFLLVENRGPWGADALLDARMPRHVREGLRLRSESAGVRTLLIRRHRNALPEPGIRVFASVPRTGLLETALLGSAEDLLDLDLDALGRGASPGLTPTDEPVVCVCTHGRHDACCAETGRPVAATLARTHPRLTWEVSHIGGDRFAANLLVLPQGLYYGRVTPGSAPSLVDAHVAGRLDLDLLRGRSTLPFAVQAAEVALRRETGALGLDDVLVGAVTRDGSVTSVRMDVDGSSYDVRVRRTEGERTRLTCRALRDDPVPRHEVLGISRASGGGPSSGRSSTPSPRA